MRVVQAQLFSNVNPTFIAQLIRDIRAAMSYVSFYSADSPFVVQAVQKCHRSLQKLLQQRDPLIFYLSRQKLLLNGSDLSELSDLFKIFQDKNIRGLLIKSGLTPREMSLLLKQVALPVAVPNSDLPDEREHFEVLAEDVEVEMSEAPAPEERESPIPDANPPSPEPVLSQISSPSAEDPSRNREKDHFPEASLYSPNGVKEESDTLLSSASLDSLNNPDANQETLLTFLAEAWQYSQLQKKALDSVPETAGLTQTFDKLFNRLLDRMEKTSPDFSQICQWFKTPQGDLLETQSVQSMYPLMEVAIKNNWIAVLYDPATQGLISDCLTFWGANGQHELVEKTVISLSQGLTGDSIERQLALTHLMDARPWVRHPQLLDEIFGKLNFLLANETIPGLYQSALLLAWDLMEPSLENNRETQVMNLMATLHFHADEDSSPFMERSHIARHWLFERSTPEVIRRLVHCAFAAKQLRHFTLLGEMAAPLLLEDFFMSPAMDRSTFFPLFQEIKASILSALAERLASTHQEEDVKKLIPILRACGIDAGLSLQLSSWLSKGSQELKLDLLNMIEEVNDPAGGPALRLAVFDDNEEIAALAARIIGKIRFQGGVPVLLKAVKIREGRFSNNDQFLISVCQALGDLRSKESVPFLEDLARKKALLRGKNYSMPVRLEAIQALTNINNPKVWTFLSSLMEEKNKPLQEALDRIIHEKIQTLS